MVKFMILFLKPANVDEFESAYTHFLALVEQMPDISRRQVVHVQGSPTGFAPYYRILEIYYPDMATLEASLRSKTGQGAGAVLGNRFPARSFEAIFAEVYEEAGGQTGS
ncbi:MAG: EthD family reductase [Chloroflexi bacterium]|nr:EthD family reductase [Chloroflexota bacterium]